MADMTDPQQQQQMQQPPPTPQQQQMQLQQQQQPMQPQPSPMQQQPMQQQPQPPMQPQPPQPPPAGGQNSPVQLDDAISVVGPTPGPRSAPDGRGTKRARASGPEEDDDGDGDGNRERRKIEIKFITDKSRRHITFSKRKAGIMKKAYELSVLTGTQVLLLVVSETGLVYTFTTPKLQPLVTKSEGKNLIQACLNAPEPASGENAAEDQRQSPHAIEPINQAMPAQGPPRVAPMPAGNPHMPPNYMGMDSQQALAYQSYVHQQQQRGPAQYGLPQHTGHQS